MTSVHLYTVFKDVGFSDKQAVSIMQAIENSQPDVEKVVTKEHLDLALSATESKLKHELYVAGFLALVPIYGKLFGWF